MCLIVNELLLPNCSLFSSVFLYEIIRIFFILNAFTPLCSYYSTLIFNAMHCNNVCIICAQSEGKYIFRKNNEKHMAFDEEDDQESYFNARKDIPLIPYPEDEDEIEYDSDGNPIAPERSKVTNIFIQFTNFFISIFL